MIGYGDTHGTAVLNASGWKHNKKKIMSQDRRNDFDVTNTVQVSKTDAVRDAVERCRASASDWEQLGVDWTGVVDSFTIYGNSRLVIERAKREKRKF